MLHLLNYILLGNCLGGSPLSPLPESSPKIVAVHYIIEFASNLSPSGPRIFIRFKLSFFCLLYDSVGNLFIYLFMNI